MNTEKMTIAPHVREIADSNAIRSATVELTRFTSDLGEWEVITQFLEMRGGGDWAEIFNRVEFFDQAEALEHMSDKVNWISNRSANLWDKYASEAVWKEHCQGGAEDQNEGLIPDFSDLGGI